MHDAQEDPRPDSVTLLFSEFVEASARDPGLELEAWVRARPGLDGSLVDDLIAVRDRLRRFVDEVISDGVEAEPGDVTQVRGRRVGPYRLEERIGRGGMGEVWRAVEVERGREVALKLRRAGPRDTAAGPADGGRAEQRFEREARLGLELDHPSIVRTLDAGEAEGFAWIALEYVPGERSLADAIAQQARAAYPGPDWVRSAAVWARDVARAAAYLHDRGLLHRDIKPSNVLLTPAGAARLADFGVARDEADLGLTSTGDPIGTVPYMSPEQVLGRSLDARADVYGIGVTLFELLALQRPFVGTASVEVAHRIVSGDALPLGGADGSVPTDLATVALHAMELRPADRYRGAAELADDLDRYLAGEPILARPPGRAERARRWVRRHPVRALLAVGAAVAVALLIAFTLWVTGVNRELVARELTAQAPLDLQELERLERALPALEPCWPDRIPALEAWLADFRALQATLGPHALPSGHTHPGHRAALASGETPSAFEGELVARLEALGDAETGAAGDAVAPAWGWGVARRLAAAQELARATAEGTEYARRWAEAVERVRRSPHYAGLDLLPQTDLLPLGPDPTTGLEEFAHLLTGEPPVRDEAGRLHVEAGTSAVLVLLPGGRFLMGAQAEDPGAPNYDPTAHVDQGPPAWAEVAPFFLSKYELTETQWERLRRDDPSQNNYRLHGVVGLVPTSPVTNVSLQDCRAALRQVGLRVPTEVEWEYGARGGTSTPWWTGTEKESLIGAENVCDLTAADYRTNEFPKHEPWYDGFILSAPVDALLPNPFGLHHVHGNVAEVTSSGIHEYPAVIPLGWDGEPGEQVVIARGGIYGSFALYGTSSVRHAVRADARSASRGVRPARSLEGR